MCNKIMLFLLLSICIITSTSPTVANSYEEIKNENNNDSFNHSFGFGAGITTGYGLSYRFLKNRFGIQTNFAPYFSKNEYHLSTGLSFLYLLENTQRLNLYLYQGNHLLWESWSNWSHSFYSMYNGLGVGIEIIIYDRASFNIMGGIAGIDSFNEISITAELGLYFLF